MIGWLIVSLSGCQTPPAVPAPHETSHPNLLRLTTTDGEVITFVLNDEINPAVLIALQTTVANYAILRAELIQGEQAHQQRQDNLTALRYGLYTLCFLATLTAITILLLRRGGEMG